MKYSELLSVYLVLPNSLLSLFLSIKSIVYSNKICSRLIFSMLSFWIQNMQTLITFSEPFKLKSAFLLTCSVTNILLVPLCIGLEVRVINNNVTNSVLFVNRLTFYYLVSQGGAYFHLPRRMGIVHVYFDGYTRLQRFIHAEKTAV